MRIIYLHQYFITPTMQNVGVSGTRSYEFAKRLVSWGHEVNMITAYPLDDSFKTGWFESNEDGITVHWLPVPYSNKMGIIKRIISFLRFAIGASFKASSMKADVLFATSTPLTIALPALFASWRLRIPMVFEVRDLWPEAPKQMNVLKSPILFLFAKKLERLAYNRSKHVIGLSPGMCDGIRAEKTDVHAVTLIPNCCDLEKFRPNLDASGIFDFEPFKDKLLILYFGTMGPANGIDYILKIARHIQRLDLRKKCLFLFIGDGKEKEALSRQAVEWELRNVIFYGSVTKAEMPKFVAAADMTFLTFKNIPILQTNSPNKFFDSLSAGKAVVNNTTGWIKNIIEENNCGINLDPLNPSGAAQDLFACLNRKEKIIQMGQNARLLAEAKYSRDDCARDLERILQQAVDGSC